MEELSGKTALVTGSTDGVGRLVARKLGQAGARVLVHGRDAERGARVIANPSRSQLRRRSRLRVVAASRSPGPARPQSPTTADPIGCSITTRWCLGTAASGIPDLPPGCDREPAGCTKHTIRHHPHRSKLARGWVVRAGPSPVAPPGRERRSCVRAKPSNAGGSQTKPSRSALTRKPLSKNSRRARVQLFVRNHAFAGTPRRSLVHADARRVCPGNRWPGWSAKHSPSSG
jgi:hypothetical protein